MLRSVLSLRKAARVIPRNTRKAATEQLILLHNIRKNHEAMDEMGERPGSNRRPLEPQSNALTN